MYISHIPLPSANKAAHSGFESQRRHHQKMKTGVSVAHQKGLMFSKNFLDFFLKKGMLKMSKVIKKLRKLKQGIMKGWIMKILICLNRKVDAGKIACVIELK